MTRRVVRSIEDDGSLTTGSYIPKLILSEFNHWCCERCARISNRPEKVKTHVVAKATACCTCGEVVKKGHIIREHPKSPTLKHCKGAH